MKTKLSPEKIETQNAPVLTPDTEASQDEAIPPGLEYFAKLKEGGARSYVLMLFPKLQNAPPELFNQALESVAGMLSGIPVIDFGVQVPEWVKEASRRSLDLIGINFDEIKNGKMSALGKVVGMMETLPINEAPQELKNSTAILAVSARADAAKLSAKDAVNFFSGVESMDRTLQKLQQPPQRTKVFVLISAAWREIEKFESAGQLHKWLLKMGVIVPQTDAAETRKICRIIGLKFRGNAGRPSKQK